MKAAPWSAARRPHPLENRAETAPFKGPTKFGAGARPENDCVGKAVAGRDEAPECARVDNRFARD